VTGLWLPSRPTSLLTGIFLHRSAPLCLSSLTLFCIAVDFLTVLTRCSPLPLPSPFHCQYSRYLMLDLTTIFVSICFSACLGLSRYIGFMCTKKKSAVKVCTMHRRTQAPSWMCEFHLMMPCLLSAWALESFFIDPHPFAFLP